jgi:serine/threonine protein kinase
MPAPQQNDNDLKSGNNSRSARALPAAPVSSDRALPRRFGRLTLLKQIARGGMGEVFLATTGGIEGAERPCVVKIIRREHSDDRSFLARFLDEARIQAQLQHPGVAQILEAATDPSGKPFVVVEYVEGRNLGELRNRASQLGARVAWPDAVAVGVSLAAALAHVHERTDAAGRPLEIVHRDLSPQNIMVGYDGDVKLIDFGTARGENRRCHTVSGIVFAKPGYVAPEVANNNPGGAPADIYAFGIMLWELLAGRRFLKGEPSEHLAAVAAGKRNPPPIAEAAGAPTELDAIIARMTAAPLDERYAESREVMTDLAQLLKRAPSLADGERSVRARIARLVRRLYPAEPARSRAEFARLVSAAHQAELEPESVQKSPTPAPSFSFTPSLLAGTRYRLVRELGRGGMGVVYEAYHVDLNRAVALKVLPKERASSSQFAERFRAEARAIARLRHDNLVALHDFGLSSDNRPYYAMELLEGESLEQLLEREQGMDWREAVRLAMQVCDALEVAHRSGVIHRDIKPGNLFISRDQTVKLLDFGIAAMDIPNESSESNSGALTVFGTPEYMAPEQVKREPTDERTDIYSLGTVLYELVASELPFSEPSTVALLDAKTRRDPEPPRVRAPKRGIPIMLDKTIQRAVARDPAERFQDASEMRDALAAALHEPLRARRRRRRVGFIALGALVIAAGALTVMAVRNPDVRARAYAMAQPIIEKARSFRNSTSAPVAVTQKTTSPSPEASELPKTERERAQDSPEAQPAEQVGGTVAGDTQEDPQADEMAAQNAPEPAEQDGSHADTETTFAAQPVSGTTPSDDLERELAEASDLMEKGARIKAFNQFRRLGKKHRKDPRALKAWSEAAARMKGWGEAYRVARQWAEVDQTTEARMHLARMQRAVGKRDDAIQTLSQLLQDSPRCAEARELLRIIGGKAPLAMN